MKKLQCYIFVCSVVFVVADNTTAETTTEKKIENEKETIEVSSETFKKLMWKKCSNNSYVTCAKLALVHVIERLDSSESYILLPGVSLQKKNEDGTASNTNEIVVRHDFNEALDRYLIEKIKRYLGSLTLSVKLLDKNTIEDVRSFGNMITDSSNVETGRGKKKYMHSLLMAGWMSGATLLALTMKTIAILSGKALLAALLSLMLSVISAFGKGHAETKSTTYEIITKPIVAHSHSTDIHEAHASELKPDYLPYKRSISPELIIKTDAVPSDIEHIIRKIKERAPYYAPVAMEYSKS